MGTDTRPISALLQDIVGNIQNIVRAEVRLAKAEAREELGKVRSAGALYAVGAVAAMLSAIFLLLALVYALSNVMPPWAAALIVGATIGVVAALTIQRATKRFRTIQAAPKTTASVKENVEWAKQLTR